MKRTTAYCLNVRILSPTRVPRQRIRALVKESKGGAETVGGGAQMVGADAFLIARNNRISRKR
jgi:hypothetical protein